MSAEGIINEICADVEDRLEGIASFALVVWLDGRPEDPKAVCVAGPPGCQSQIAVALATGIRVLGRQ